MTARPTGDPQAQGLASFLASMKLINGGKYGAQGTYENGVRPFGAYGMLKENWEPWSAGAGLNGANPSDPAAQDSVAAYWAQKLFQRYGDWDMVAAAWFAGAKQTDDAARSGEGVGYFKNEKTREFIAKYTESKENENVSRATLQGAARQWINPNGAPRGWLSPVAGASEYSQGSWMPNTTNHRGRTHAAIDVYAAKGAPIVAPVGGKVLSTKKSTLGGYTVRVQGTDGLTYYFAHMNEAAVVRPGEQISAGAHLGFVGNSGSARNTKPHIHFSIKKGNTPVNPYTYLEGSKNAGNYYDPEKADHAAGEPEPISTKYTNMLNVISNRVAGGQRTDYRNMGRDIPDDEMGAPDDTSIMGQKLKQKATQPQKGAV